MIPFGFSYICSMTLLIIFFLLSISFSFLCSVLEAVLLSITPSYVQRISSDGTSSLGKILQTYKKDIDRPLSAILTLNTIAHTVGAIGVGAQAGEVFGAHNIDLGFMSLSYESIVAGVMTLAILILSEIIPKTIGANNWEKLTPFTVRTLQGIMWILTPFVWLSQLITKSLKKDKDRPVLSRADFIAMAQMGGETGVLKDAEQAVILNMLSFQKSIAREVMTPKRVIFMGQGNTTLREFYDAHTPIQFSRIPVYGTSRDDVTGILLKDDLLKALVEGKSDATLASIQRPVTSVPADATLMTVMDKLTQNKTHMAIIHDEYGGVTGLITQEDVIETLLGIEIVDEFDRVEDLQQFAKDLWEKKQKDM